MSQKATLEEMAALVQEEADHLHGVLSHYSKHYPDMPPDNARYRRKHVLESTAHVLRVMATFEDRSRQFIGGLLQEHGRE